MAKDQVQVSDVRAWVEAGNFEIDGDLVSPEDLRQPKIMKAARAAYLEAVNPQSAEEKERKKREARTFTVVLFSGDREIVASESVPNDQRLLKEETHASYKDSLTMLQEEDEKAFLVVLVSDAGGTSIEGMQPAELLSLLQR